MREVQFTPSPKPRPKLDPRLTTLIELGAKAFVPGGFGALEKHTARDCSGMRREGPLAFLRDENNLEIAPVPVVSAAERRKEVPPSVPVFIRTTTSSALDRLAASGVRLISRARTVATADVQLIQIPELEKDQDVVSIEWTGAFRPMANEAGSPESRGACAAIGIEPGRIGGLDGRDCVIGVVDVEGIDFYHPSFVSRSGRTRLLTLWDQRASTACRPFQGGVELGPGGLGVVYRRAAIGLEIAPHQLIPNRIVDHRTIKGSHGTLVSALAVGNGDERPDARGAAPGADLVFVSTFGSGPGSLGAMTELSDGIAFIVAEAEALGRPCVVNISLGDDLGPRDGTSPVERFIDELLEVEGRAIVVAAGNSHTKKRHVTATLADGETATFALHVAPRNTERAVVEIWYPSGAELPTALSLRIEAPGDGGSSPAIEADGIPRAFDARDTRVLVLSTALYPGSNNGMARIELLPHDLGDDLLPGSWRFHVSVRGGGGPVHAWVDHRYAHWENASDSLTLTTPATARRALVVGAYDERKDGPARFSGRGKARDGASRPDILAPGVSLVGAWAASPVRYIETACGTSMATPITSGVAALVFQRRGRHLSAKQVREAILSLSKPTAASGLRRLWVGDPSAVEGMSVERAVDAPARSSPPEEHAARGALPRLRPRDAAQIIQGVYAIYAENERVGEVLVIPGDRPGATVEYWALGPRFTPPSRDRPHTAIQFQYRGEAIDLESFTAGLEHGSRCVRAACEIALIPHYRGATLRSNCSDMEPVTIEPRSNEMTKNYMRPLDRTQIIQGKYKLYQDKNLVGALRVTDDAPGRSTEHWLLYSDYLWPSETNNTQEIVFQYQDEPGELDDFLRDAPSGATYVIARCEQQTLP